MTGAEAVRFLNTPLTIGGEGRWATLPNRLFLAPMAGVSDLAFRRLCREQGAGLTAMEMISAKAICYGNRNTLGLMKTCPQEQPVSLQLFGHEPEFMEEACRRIEGESFQILDINMGCPVPKITGNGEGSALMRDPELIRQMVEAAVRGSRRPVTAKLRLGYDDEHKNVVECARAAEAGGASMIAVHGRTRPQMYSGKADWHLIGEVKQAVSIPVVGNGDIADIDSAAAILTETGCDAVMVGRACRGNPWVFAEILAGSGPVRRTPQEIAAMLRRHARLAVEDKGERVAMREMRSHAAWYFTGFPGASGIRAKAGSLATLEDLESLLGTLELGEAPDPNKT